MKKAQSLSLNTIVIMALALLVLVVLIFIFGDKARVAGFTISQSCADMGGTPATLEESSDGESTSKRWVCSDDKVLKWTSRCDGAVKDEKTRLCGCCVSVI